MGLTLSQKVVANPGTFAESSELDRRPDLRVPSTEPRLIVSLRLTCESIAVSNRRVGFYETHLPVHNGVLIEQGRMRLLIDRRFSTRCGRSVPHRHRRLRCVAAVIGSTLVSLPGRQVLKRGLLFGIGKGNCSTVIT